MNIWYVNIGDSLPLDKEDRPLRSELLVEALNNAGHNVVWWSSTFHHQRKLNRYNKDKIIKINNKLEIRLLHSISYKKNASFKRILNHVHIALKAKKEMLKFNPPDVIIASYPTIEMAYESVKYGTIYNIPVIIDIRDLWPETFKELLPLYLNQFSNILLYPFYKKAKYIFKNAYAITGITGQYIDFGLSLVNRKKSEINKPFPFGYPLKKLSEKEKNKAFQKLKEKCIDINNKELFPIVFLGTIGRHYDMITVIDAAEKLKYNTDIVFILCGNGEDLSFLKNEVLRRNLKNIIFPGWIGLDEIILLMEYSKVALAPYKSHKNFLYNITNKVVEYLAGGLPILSSIDGEIGKLIKKHNVGMVYSGKTNLLVDYILKLKQDEKLRLTISFNAKKLFNQRFSAETVYNNMVKYIENIRYSYKG